MPFTLAHPAAVMPLRRLKFLQPQALIIGSMMPDLPYFLPRALASFAPKGDTHSFPGSFYLDVPFGLIVICAVLLLRYPLTALLPDRAKWICLDAAQRFIARPLNWLVTIPSLLIGAWTHIVWDSFTHDPSWVTQRVEVLTAPVSLFGLYTGEVAHLLQYVSSVFGLLVLAYWYYLATKEAPHDYAPRALTRPRRLLLLGLVIFVAAVIGILQAIRVHDFFRSTLYSWGYLILTRWVAWCGLLFFVTGAIVTLADRAHVARIKSAQKPEHA